MRLSSTGRGERRPGPPFLEEVEDGGPEGQGKGGVAQEGRHHVDEEPVALQGRHQRSDLAVYAERGVGQQQAGEQGHQGPQVALEVAPKGQEAQGRQAPGEKDQGLIEVGQGRLDG